MTIWEYLSSLKGKTVAVLGIGVSNTPLISLLRKHGISVFACDKKERKDLGDTAEYLESLGVKLYLGEDYLDHLAQADVIFRTPGMRPDVKQLLAAKERGSVVTSEMQVFFSVSPCPIIAVTGSDGKTTTTTLIAEMLRAAGKRVHIGGNIGHPLLADTLQMQGNDYAVVELSSFQLMDMTISPHIAVVTNLAPNHLDVHHGMEEYIEAKTNVYRYQKDGDIAVFNADNKITAQLAQSAKHRVRTFSRVGTVQDGAVLKDAMIILRRGGEERAVLKTSEIRIPGEHNVENYLAAITAVDGLVPDECIAQVAREFSGVEHRIEFVRDVRGVKWYNDSIASSPTRTIAGLRSFAEKVILIAGGYDKHIPFDVLGDEITAHVKTLILCGATADKIEQAVRECKTYPQEQTPIITIPTLADAVRYADEIAQKGDIVLLSPACAAFDQFANFMERGKIFKEMVNALSE